MAHNADVPGWTMQGGQVRITDPTAQPEVVPARIPRTVAPKIVAPEDRRPRAEAPHHRSDAPMLDVPDRRVPG